MAEAVGFEQELSESHEEQKQLREQIHHAADERSLLAQERDRLLAERQALETERDQLMARIEGDRERLQQLGVDGVGSLTRMIEDLTAQRSLLERELNETQAALGAAEDRLEILTIRSRSQPQVVHRPTDPEVLLSMVQELRTPMTSIIGYVDLLLGESAGILGEMQRKFLQRVAANVTRLTLMLDDLIRISFLDAGEFTLMPESVDVIELIEDAITGATNQLREKGLTVHMSLDEDAPLVRADRDAINQVIGQLLTNAYLASPPRSEIFISARTDHRSLAAANDQPVDCLHVAVEDRGGGIALEDQPRVFARKYKAENPLIQGLGDTGVGLAIAKALVEAHGGEIWLETEANVGSRFNVVLPMEPMLVGER
jgi:signal transduction histidine kinase